VTIDKSTAQKRKNETKRKRQKEEEKERKQETKSLLTPREKRFIAT